MTQERATKKPKLKAKDRRLQQTLELVESGRSNQALQAFNRLKPRDLSAAIDHALRTRTESESLKYAIREHHLSRNGDMPMKALHTLILKQPHDFDFYKSLRTQAMEKLARDPAMLDSFIQYAQNATGDWEDTAFKEVIKTASNGEDLYGFIGIVHYDGKRKLTPHIVFHKDREEAFHKVRQTLLHNVMDRKLMDATPENDLDGYDFVQIDGHGNVSYKKHMNVRKAADALNHILDKHGLGVENKSIRTRPFDGEVTYTFEIVAEDLGEDGLGLREVFTRSAENKQKARRNAAMAVVNSRFLFDLTGYTALPQTHHHSARSPRPVSAKYNAPPVRYAIA